MDYRIITDKFTMQVETNQRAVRDNVIKQYIKIRKGKGLTQEQVANVSGIKRSNITRFESGNYNPSLDMMVKIAESMGAEIEIRIVEKNSIILEGDYDER